MLVEIYKWIVYKLKKVMTKYMSINNILIENFMGYNWQQ
jgi:hypothetical protein